jgi:uncharacterized protein (TIGR03067 family)
LILSALISLDAVDDPAPVAKDDLQGTWLAVEGHKASGEALSAQAFRDVEQRMTFNGDQMTNTMNGKSFSFRIALDPSQSPRQIDWFVREGTPPMLGIYRLKEDRLEIAWAAGFGSPRPSELVPCPKEAVKKWTYGVYQREKKADEPAVTREAECRWTEQAPTIDGKLDDPAWRSASVIDRFPAFWKKSETAPAHATKAKLVWDREALYYSAEMVDADVRAFGTKHNDHLWNGDVFEMFFKPSLDRPQYFEFQVNPKSVLFEAAFLERNKPVEPFESSKPLGMSAVAATSASGWTVEGRIPWTAFGPTFSRPSSGEEWSFALCRYDYFGPDKTPPVLMSSAPLTRPSFHRFEDFGRLRFVGPASR